MKELGQGERERREEQTQAEKTTVQVDHLPSTGEQSPKYWNSSTECQLWLCQVNNGTKKKSEYQVFMFFHQALSEVKHRATTFSSKFNFHILKLISELTRHLTAAECWKF